MTKITEINIAGIEDLETANNVKARFLNAMLQFTNMMKAWGEKTDFTFLQFTEVNKVDGDGNKLVELSLSGDQTFPKAYLSKSDANAIILAMKGDFKTQNEVVEVKFKELLDKIDELENPAQV